MYRSVLNADFVLAILEVIKVSNSVLHPVLVITLGEILTCVRTSALLQQKQINQHGVTTRTHTHTNTLTHSLLYTHTHTHTHWTHLKNWNRSMEALGAVLWAAMQTAHGHET